MRFIAAVTAAAVLLLAAPAQAAETDLTATPGNVVVGATSTSWTTLRATGVPSWVQLIDADLYGPNGAHHFVDLNIRNIPDAWEGEVAFNHVDQPGAWRVTLKLIGQGRTATGPKTTFTVKRRTALSAPAANSRTRTGLNGVLKRLLGNGHYVPYTKQKVRLYRWTGQWVYTATDRTDAKGRYAFKARTGKYQVRYAGTAVNSSAIRTF